MLYVYHKEKMIMLFSYIDKQNSGEKNVIVLSNMHENVKVTKDQRKKTEVHIQSHKRGSWCCWFVVKESFYKGRIKEIVATCRSNAKTILGDNNIKFTNFEFKCNLGKALVLLSIKRRHRNSNELRIRIINKMLRVLGIKEV